MCPRSRVFRPMVAATGSLARRQRLGLLKAEVLKTALIAVEKGGRTSSGTYRGAVGVVLHHRR